MEKLFRKKIELFVEEIRPPKHLRNKIDISFEFENNTLIIYQENQDWKDESKLIPMEAVKARFIKSKSIWKIYWMRSTLKWELYNPHSEADSLEKVFEIIKEDEFGCFFG